MEMKKYSNGKLILLAIAFLFIVANAKHTLLMLRSDGANFVEAKSGLAYELEYDFDIVDLIIDKDATVEVVAKAMEENSPKLVVLMNNTAISLYKKYQQTLPDGSEFVPSVSLMGILVDEVIDDIKNSYGIEYEIPIVTSTVNLRTLMGADKIKKIGIVHRSNMKTFIEENRKYCANEGIVLETIELETDEVEAKLEKSLKTLVKEKNVDAIWVPVDNKIVNKNLLMGTWIPFQKKNQMPIIVGVGTLVNPKFHFGTFAVLPDHVALGSQAASVIFDIMDNNWEISESGDAQPPLSVYTILNYPDSKEYFGLDKNNLNGVDKIIE